MKRLTPAQRIKKIAARQQQRREKQAERNAPGIAAERRRQAPRSCVKVRNKCETTKRYLAERAAAAEEEATEWVGDPQRWAGLTLFSQMLRLMIEHVDDVLYRLNELLLKAEVGDQQPIEAVIELGRELRIEKRLGAAWAERCRKPYEPGAWKRNRKRRRRKLKTPASA